MPGLAFISYRRDDTREIAQALYLQLQQEFGSGQLFMDVNSIRVGEAWPDRVRARLADATVLVALIGPGWLTAADKYGRRRIDDPTDWVRNEVAYALENRIPILPLVINHTQNLPDPDGLPDALKSLPLVQARVLHLDADWIQDVDRVAGLLSASGLMRQPLPPQPSPSGHIVRTYPPLTESQLAEALEGLPEWEEWVDTLAVEYPRVRQELRRTLSFKDFKEAMAFMTFIAPRFDESSPPHHPRWANEWNVVRIRMTTWDVGNKITRLDVDTAQMIDAEYRKFKSRSRNR